MNKDYYEILGVAKTAETKEIKKSFRILAKKYHPDISKEVDAETKFKEIQEAYEVLSHPEKRQQYDKMGHDYFKQQSNHSQNTNYYSGFSQNNVRFVKFKELAWYWKVLLVLAGIALAAFVIILFIIYSIIKLIINIIRKLTNS